MLITCPYCGRRSLAEFTYGGDASVPPIAQTEDELYLRDNPRGRHRERWQHVFGCRQWLVVTRDTLTHDIESVEPVHAPSSEIKP